MTTEQTSEQQVQVQKGIYKHAKTGNLYRVIATGKHTETLEDLVVYESLYENKISKIWIRPVTMFTEIVTIGETKTPRFVFVSSDTE